MAGNINWQSGAVQSLAMQLSGQGSQLTNGSAVALGVILDNTGVSGGPAFFGLAELVCSQSGFGAGVLKDVSVDLYLVPSRDGTNFPNVDVDGGNLPPTSFKGSFVVTVSGNNQARMSMEGIPLLPVKYTGYIKNGTGQTLTSGWSFFMDLYSEAYT